MSSDTTQPSLPTAPVIVLGMHKSGTTLVAETLHHSGVEMIEINDPGGYDSGNKMERENCRLLNIDLLGCHTQLSVHIINGLDLETITAENWQKGRDLLYEMKTAGGRWGFKDPRTLLTYGFWTKIIPERKIIGVFRDPVEVFRHYSKRPVRRWILSDPLYLLSALKAWCVYNTRLLEFIHSGEDMLLIEYADLMQRDETLDQMMQYVGLPMTDRRKANMRRSSTQETRMFSLAQALVKKVYGFDTQQILKDLRAVKRNRGVLETLMPHSEHDLNSRA